MCFTINTAMCLLQILNALSVITELLNFPHTHKFWDLNQFWVVWSKYSQHINSFRPRKSQENKGRVSRRNVQLCSSACLLNRSQLAGKLAALVFFFALYGHKSGWVRERDSKSEDGGVVYCFWRKRCRVTCCLSTFGACCLPVTSFLSLDEQTA